MLPQPYGRSHCAPVSCGAHRNATGLFQCGKIFQHGLGLLRSSQPRPQGIKSGGVNVGGSLAGQKVVIEEKSLLWIPKIARDQLLAFFGFFVPLRSIGAMAQPPADLLQIFLCFIEQAVEAHGGIVMRCRAEWPESKADVEARLSHGAVALVVVRTQFEFARAFRNPAAPSWRRRRRPAGNNATPAAAAACPRAAFDNVVVRLRRMKKEIGGHLAVESSFILHGFCGRAFAEIVVARQASLSGQVRIDGSTSRNL